MVRKRIGNTWVEKPIVEKAKPKAKKPKEEKESVKSGEKQESNTN